MDRKGNVPDLIKWSCDMQPIEDCGGFYAYIQLRQLAEKMPQMKKKEFEKAADELGYEDPEWLMETLDEARIDPEFIAEELYEI